MSEMKTGKPTYEDMILGGISTMRRAGEAGDVETVMAVYGALKTVTETVKKAEVEMELRQKTGREQELGGISNLLETYFRGKIK